MFKLKRKNAVKSNTRKLIFSRSQSQIISSVTLDCIGVLFYYFFKFVCLFVFFPSFFWVIFLFHSLILVVHASFLCTSFIFMHYTCIIKPINQCYIDLVCKERNYFVLLFISKKRSILYGGPACGAEWNYKM